MRVNRGIFIKNIGILSARNYSRFEINKFIRLVENKVEWNHDPDTS